MNSKDAFLHNLFILFLILIITQALYACGSAAPATEAPPEPTNIPSTLVPASAEEQGAVLETRRLTLEFPPKIKADSASDIVRLTL